MDKQYYGEEIFYDITNKLGDKVLKINSFKCLNTNFIFFYNYITYGLFTEIKKFITSKNNNECIVSILYCYYEKNLIEETRINAPYRIVFMTNLSNIYEVEVVNKQNKLENQFEFIDKSNMFTINGNITNNYSIVITILKEYNVPLEKDDIEYLKSLSSYQHIIVSSNDGRPGGSKCTYSSIETIFNDSLKISKIVSGEYPTNSMYFDYIINTYNKVAQLAKNIKSNSDLFSSEIDVKNKLINSLEYENTNLDLANSEMEAENTKLINEIKKLNNEISTLKNTIIESEENNSNYWFIPKPFT